MNRANTTKRNGYTEIERLTESSLAVTQPFPTSEGGLLVEEFGMMPSRETHFYAEALKNHPNHAFTRKLFSICLAREGRLREAADEINRAYEIAFGPLEPQQWTGGDPWGREIILWPCSGGLGDTFMFARYAKLLADRGAIVIADVPRTQAKLISTVPGISTVVSGVATSALKRGWHCPYINLPFVCSKWSASILANVPYLKADQALVRRWRDRLSSEAFRVGLVWAGSADNPLYKAWRSLPSPQLLKPITGIPGIKFYGLQFGWQERTAERTCQLAAIGIENLSSHITDFSDTAAIIENLDLVISVDTSTAHLTGAMGKPLWVMLPKPSAWQWMADREDSPWYPTAKLFRQRDAGDWREPIGRVAEALEGIR